MGMLYRRKKRDQATGQLIEKGPWWAKYYEDGRPTFRSTRTEDKSEARKKLNKWEGQVADGLHEGEAAAAGIPHPSQAPASPGAPEGLAGGLQEGGAQGSPLLIGAEVPGDVEAHGE